jgi:hypothetical protein
MRVLRILSKDDCPAFRQEWWTLQREDDVFLGSVDMPVENGRGDELSPFPVMVL